MDSGAHGVKKPGRPRKRPLPSPLGGNVERIGVNLSPESACMLREVSEREGKPMAAVVRELLCPPLRARWADMQAEDAAHGG